MTSSPRKPEEAYVWVWLPGETEPLVAGRLAPSPAGLQFNYGRSYLARRDAIALYLPELPLQPGLLPLPAGLTMPGCLRDAAPDAWGRRVIINRLMGAQGSDTDTAVLNELTYLLESGSDRVGALDFQRSPTTYETRSGGDADLEVLLEAAAHVERGTPLPSELETALLHGTSLGGARPKAMLVDGDRKCVAKFSSTTDVYPVAKAEYIAMRLAGLVGLDVAPVTLVQAAGRDVLLVERFDRSKTAKGWQRKAVVSALTILELDEMMARYASYEALAEAVRHRFARPRQTLRELFARMVFNVLCGNTDDHARNHAAFWDGSQLSLTPAYDICPQARTGNEASQAMLIHGDNRLSRLSVCLRAAPQFLMSEADARALVERQIAGIGDHWQQVCDEAALSAVDRNLLWKRQFLNPDVMVDYPAR